MLGTRLTASFISVLLAVWMAARSVQAALPSRLSLPVSQMSSIRLASTSSSVELTTIFSPGSTPTTPL